MCNWKGCIGKWLAFSLAIFLLSTLLVFKISNLDIWANLATGREIVRGLQIPAAEPFAYTGISTFFVIHTWLSDVIFYVFYHYFSIESIIILKSFIYLAVFIIFLRYGVKKDLTIAFSCLLLLPAFFLASERFFAKAEMFGVLYFSVFFYFLDSYIHEGKNKYLLCLSATQILWANQHGSFLLGILIVLIYAASSWLEKIFSMKKIKVPGSPRRIIILLATVVLSSLVNPYGIQLLRYPSSQAGEWVFVRTIMEWLPPFSSSFGITAQLSIFVIAVSVFLFGLNWRKLNLFYYILFVFFLYMYIYSRRFVVYFSMISFVCAVDNISNLNIKKFLKKKECALSWTAVLILVIFLTGGFKQSFADGHYFDRELGLGVQDKFPEKTMQFIRDNISSLQGNMFNDYAMGGYYIWKLHPYKKVFKDGRNMAYDKDFYLKHRAVMSDPGSLWDEIADEYDIHFALLYHGYPETARIIPYLHKNKDWDLLYFDADSVFFASDSFSGDIEIIGREKFSNIINSLISSEKEARIKEIKKYGSLCMLLEEHGAAESIFEFIISEDPFNEAAYGMLSDIYTVSNDFVSLRDNIVNKQKFVALNGYDYYNLGYLEDIKGNYEDAERYYVKSLKAQKNLVRSYNNLAIIYWETNRFHRAERFFLRGHRLDPHCLDILHNLGLFYKNAKGDLSKAKYFYTKFMVSASYKYLTGGGFPDIEMSERVASELRRINGEDTQPRSEK